MINSTRATHACLIECQSEEERLSLALELAAAELCEKKGKNACRHCRHCEKVFSGIHPDITVIKRALDDKGKKRPEIYIAQVREVIADCAVLPNEAERRVFLFLDADTMNRSAQNAVLKLLEEPPDHVLIYLCVENSLMLLPTIRSRCMLIRKNVSSEIIENDFDDFALEFVSLFAKGDSLALTRFCAMRESLDTDSMTQMIGSARLLVADMLSIRAADLGMRREKIAYLSSELELAERYLHANVGVKHILGLLSTLLE